MLVEKLITEAEEINNAKDNKQTALALKQVMQKTRKFHTKTPSLA